MTAFPSLYVYALTFAISACQSPVAPVSSSSQAATPPAIAASAHEPPPAPVSVQPKSPVAEPAAPSNIRPSGGPQIEAERQARIFVLGTAADQKKSGAQLIGCDDVLLPKTITLRPDLLTGQLIQALTEVIKAQGMPLNVRSVNRDNDRWTVDLHGQLTLAGVCDSPRKKIPLEKTAEEFGTVEFHLNGDAVKWRCLGNESGECH